MSSSSPKPPRSYQRLALLEERARGMRRHPSPAEAALWRELSGRRAGAPFRRQVVVLGRFIADFLAPSVQLIVEVDGGFHCRQKVADARRQQALERAGFAVLRLPAQLVLQQPAAAAQLVREAVAARTRSGR